MKVNVHLDAVKYATKPSDFKEINNRIINNVECIEIRDLAHAVGTEGCTFVPAVFHERRKRENFVSQQVFAIDIDHGLSFDSAMERLRYYKLASAFIYATFSNTPDNNRFRIVFVNDCMVTDRAAAEIMLAMLMEIFPEADKNCKDVSRMFLGGVGLLYEGYGNTINYFDVAISLQMYVKDCSSNNYARKMESIARKNKILWNGKSLGIYKVTSESEEFLPKTGYIYLTFL